MGQVVRVLICRRNIHHLYEASGTITPCRAHLLITCAANRSREVIPRLTSGRPGNRRYRDLPWKQWTSDWRTPCKYGRRAQRPMTASVKSGQRNVAS